MKVILKLVIVFLMANALWHIGSAYASYYKFKDSVYAAAMDEGKSEDDLRQQILELASTYGVPLSAEAMTIHREVHRTTVQGSYKAPVAVLPGYEYAWPFKMEIDAFVIAPPGKVQDLARP